MKRNFKYIENLKIVIAGPGAGKTHSLKLEVLKCLNNLEPNRVCAVITYTNAATDELQRRISSSIITPPNLFIGTLHSFVIRYIVEPFAHLVGLSTIEKKYIESILINDVIKKNTIQKRLSENGIITFEKTLQIAKLIFKYNNIIQIVCNRIKYLFIDEYQDSHPNTHEIIEKIIETNLTSVFLIGDPLQYIYNFAIKTLKKKSTSLFKNTPLLIFKDKYSQNVVYNNINNRSSKAIINLINNYITEDKLKQIPKSSDCEIPLYFIPNYDTEGIFKEYNNIQKFHNINDIHLQNLNKKRVFRNMFL